MSKVQSLKMLEEMGLNTPELILSLGQFDQDKPVKWEALLGRLESEDKEQRVSIRTERDGEVLCPHYPNITLRQADKRIRDLHREGYAIHIFRGIDPQDCRVKGNIVGRLTGQSTEYIMEFTVGPGTVREVDRNTPQTARAINHGELQSEVTDQVIKYALNHVLELYRLHHNRIQGEILEWSHYNVPVGRLKNYLIFWEMRAWK